MGHRTSKTAKSRPSYSNGHLLSLFILLLGARCRVWRGVWIRVRSNDVRKQFARTLREESSSTSLYNLDVVENLSHNL